MRDVAKRPKRRTVLPSPESQTSGNVALAIFIIIIHNEGSVISTKGKSVSSKRGGGELGTE